MKNFSKIYGYILGSYTVILAAALIWQALSIYIAGNSAANLDANGLYKSAVYSREIAESHLQPLMWPGIMWAVMAIGGFFVKNCLPGNTVQKKKKKGAAMQLEHDMKREKEKPVRSKSSVRILLYVIAVIFVILGIFNHGMRDVLVKAINICTECIGLG